MNTNKERKKTTGDSLQVLLSLYLALPLTSAGAHRVAINTFYV